MPSCQPPWIVIPVLVVILVVVATVGMIAWIAIFAAIAFAFVAMLPGLFRRRNGRWGRRVALAPLARNDRGRPTRRSRHDFGFRGCGGFLASHGGCWGGFLKRCSWSGENTGFCR